MFFLHPSQKRLLNSLNPIFFVTFVYGVLMVRSTAASILPPMVLNADLLLPFVVFFAQRRTTWEGFILALFCSHLYSLSSSAPIGVFAFYYLVLFSLARLMRYGIYASGWISTLLALFTLSFGGRFLLPLVAASFGPAWPVFMMKNFPWSGIFFAPLYGLVIFALGEALDRATFKADRVNIEMYEAAA